MWDPRKKFTQTPSNPIHAIEMYVSAGSLVKISCISYSCLDTSTLTSLASSNVASYISLFILLETLRSRSIMSRFLSWVSTNVKLYVASYTLATTLHHTIASSFSIEISRKYRRCTMTVLYRLKRRGKKSVPNCAAIEMRTGSVLRKRALDLRLVGMPCLDKTGLG